MIELLVNTFNMIDTNSVYGYVYIAVHEVFSIFCHRIRVISITFCYTSDKLESGKNISQGKVRDNSNFKIMATLCNTYI